MSNISIKLTEREVEVALIASRGFSNKYIAKFLHISTRTVEEHIRHIYEKLSINNRDDLIELRLNNRLIHVGIRPFDMRQ